MPAWTHAQELRVAEASSGPFTEMKSQLPAYWLWNRPAARTTFPHFFVSLLMKAVNASGVLATGSAPMALRRSRSSGDIRGRALSRAISKTAANSNNGKSDGPYVPPRFLSESDSLPLPACKARCSQLFRRMSIRLRTDLSSSNRDTAATTSSTRESASRVVA
jgi:hypothetical protein